MEEIEFEDFKREVYDFLSDKLGNTLFSDIVLQSHLYDDIALICWEDEGLMEQFWEWFNLD